MKQTTKALLVGAALAFGAILIISSFLPSEVEAAEGDRAEQYKLVSLGNSDTAFEQELNQLAKQGWRVRAGMATSVIMAK